MRITGEKKAIVVVSLDPRKCYGKANRSFKLAGEVVKLSKEVKILGVTIDSQLTFASHARKMEKKSNNRTSVLTALSERTGAPLLTISGEYNTYARPGWLYAAEIWAPFLSDSNWKKLEVCNNRASRIITGATSSTPSTASKLHARTPLYKILVEDNAAFLLERYRRFPETHNLSQLCQQTVKPRLRSRGENTHRPDWRTALERLQRLEQTSNPSEQIRMGHDDRARDEYL